MNRKFSFSAVGICSLLVIFAVLCLSVFALLSVSTVLSQVRLAESTRSAVTDFYEADCKAQEILCKLRSGEIPEGVSQNGDIFRYACPISDTQELQVQVRLNGAAYTILKWQAVSTVGWEADSDLPVWDGEKGEANG